MRDAFVLGTAVGFLARRGRPGFLARMLQGWGSRIYQGWYVRNLEHALGRPLHDAARTRFQSDVVADPEGTLDPEAYQDLERHFASRAAKESGFAEV